MHARVLLLIGLLALAGRAEAAFEQWLGQTVVDVRVQTVDGAGVDDGVLELVETRLGEPLGMQPVRDTIDHLVGLGRYDDVRLSAAPAPDGTGVVLTWVLRPIQRIIRTTTVGGGDLASPALRAAVDAGLGAEPLASRAPEFASAVSTYYRDHGYRAAAVTPNLVPTQDEGAVVLNLQIDPGQRTAVASASVVGSPLEPEARILARLAVSPGRPFDGVELQERIRAYEADLRGEGRYLATVRETTTFSDTDHTAAVEIAVDAGPLVRVVYTGDPLPGGSAADSLVPVREERSADEDLLEDGSRNIEAYLRERGYRSAAAPYDRQERNGELLLTFTVTRGPLHRVNAVSLAGNATMPNAELEPLMKLTRGDPFVDARVAAIAVAIEELYRVRGYERAAVSPGIEVLPEEIDGDVRFRPVDVRFTVTEGGQLTVESVTINGADPSREPALRGALGLTAGRPFYRPLLAADRDTLERIYRNQGFLAASVTPAVAVDDAGRARVMWTVQEGEQSRVDRVLITGNERTSASVIRRELRLQPGDPLSADGIADSQRRLSQLGLFRRVRIVDVPRSGTPRRDLLVTVEEAPATAITYGGGLEVGRRLRQADEEDAPAVERVEVAPRGFIEVSRRNLFGKNRTLSFFARASLRPRDPAVDSTDPTDTGGYGLNDYRVTGTFREPRAFGRPGDAQALAFLERGIRASFTFDRVGVRGDYARRYDAGLTATVRYTLENTDIIDEQIEPEDRLLVDRLFPQVRLSTFFGGVLRDSRDDVLDPQRGTLLSLDGAAAARAYGSEIGFVKTFLQGFVYRRLPGRGFVVAGGARVGLSTAFSYEVPRVDENGDPILGEEGQQLFDLVEDLPASERFFAGGDTTVRGFALDRLGTDQTLDPQGFPQGGNGLMILNAELRAPYWKGLGLVGFVDAGNVFRRAENISVTELRVATGFGVRYRSPIGPLRVDLGFKVNPRVLASGSRERASVLHISLGQAF
jgi:outer membrane protein assembly complex protein YaeT